jgi:hypothetical protein
MKGNEQGAAVRNVDLACLSPLEINPKEFDSVIRLYLEEDTCSSTK